MNQDSNPLFLRIHAKDNVAVALQNLKAGTEISLEGSALTITADIKAKHKFALTALEAGDEIIMYGVLVGKAVIVIPKGGLLTIDNIIHASAEFKLGDRKFDWQPPDVSDFSARTFNGYHRSDGSVGTANYWLVVPLVFCENRNIGVMKDALTEKLGYKKADSYQSEVSQLIDLYQTGCTAEEILNTDLLDSKKSSANNRLFKNIDGVKFLTHTLGCGGTKLDAETLCGLLAGYITHPNVAGATVLSLGCQHAQAAILQQEILKRDPSFNKQLFILEQQKLGTENNLLQEALKQTFAGLIDADKVERKPAPLSKLCVGLECGGSDGFSGISANPALGYVSNILVALGGAVILSEFPELCGVEQELSNRCVNEQVANRFMDLMISYNKIAEQVGSGFYANPSPGNIKDGLITDAIKSAGAAKKGGTSPVVAVLDYPEKVNEKGLNLLCTPGSDVESTTAEVGAGANLVLFTTGLGTPTGNPIAPVIKLSSNSALYERMPDIIDINCGTIIEGRETIRQTAGRIINFMIQVASGEIETKATKLGQDDFIPWKRGVSL